MQSLNIKACEADYEEMFATCWEGEFEGIEKMADELIDSGEAEDLESALELLYEKEEISAGQLDVALANIYFRTERSES